VRGRQRSGWARLAVAIGALLLAAAGCSPQEWPHWRGPERSDVTGHVSGWEQGAWPLGDAAWVRQVGAGGTSPIVADGRVYVSGWVEDSDTVRCIDAATGEDVWAQSYPCAKYGRHHNADEAYYGGPSATPEYDPETGYLYTLSIDGDLNCWDAGDGGRRVWGENLYDVYGAPRRPNVGGGQRDYGYTCAPLVHGDWLIVEVGSDQGSLVAYDKRSGERVWLSQCTDPAGHSGGLVPLTVEGVPCVAVLTLSRLVVVRLDDGHVGETVATYDWATYYSNNIPTPAVAGDSIILSTAYNMNRTERVRITLGGAERVWELVGRSTGVCSPVVYEDHVYWAWRKVVCVALDSGELKWEGGACGNDGSCLVTGDGRLLVFGAKKLWLVDTARHSPDAYRELAVVDGPGGKFSWPHVALADGRVYAKDFEGNLMCWQLPTE